MGEFDRGRDYVDWGHCYFLYVDGYATDNHEYSLYATEGGLCVLEDPEMDDDGRRIYYSHDVGKGLPDRDLMRWWLDFTSRSEALARDHSPTI